MRLGQLQWALFWLAVFTGESEFFAVWLISLFFTDYDKEAKE